MKHVLSQKEVDPDTNVFLAHAHGYLKISRNPLLRVYRDVLVRKETTLESEIDLPLEPLTSRDQATDEHDVIHVQADCSVPAFAENLDDK